MIRRVSTWSSRVQTRLYTAVQADLSIQSQVAEKTRTNQMRPGCLQAATRAWCTTPQTSTGSLEHIPRCPCCDCPATKTLLAARWPAIDRRHTQRTIAATSWSDCSAATAETPSQPRRHPVNPCQPPSRDAAAHYGTPPGSSQPCSHHQTGRALLPRPVQGPMHNYNSRQGRDRGRRPAHVAYERLQRLRLSVIESAVEENEQRRKARHLSL